MATEYSSIDDVLESSKNGTQPAAPESIYAESVENSESPHVDILDLANNDNLAEQAEARNENGKDSGEKLAHDTQGETDEYGNFRAAPKIYTEDEVNERINRAIRERLARGQQPTNQPTQQAQAGFEYNAESSETWENQLESFVEKTYHKIGQREAQRAQDSREHQAQVEFEGKFTSGMTKFPDFVDVVSKHHITDAMTIATRSMSDPAAFVYAAAKRAPDELKRISAINDPYAQIVEMGRLEERLKKQKAMTSTPRPVGRTKSDSSITHTSDKEPTIEELIAKADARKKAQLVQRSSRR